MTLVARGIVVDDAEVEGVVAETFVVEPVVAAADVLASSGQSSPCSAFESISSARLPFSCSRKISLSCWSPYSVLPAPDCSYRLIEV